MLTFTLLVLLGLGIVLCFFGYRFFRTAMALAGFAIGAVIGYYGYGIASEYLPGSGSGVWLLLFMGAGGVLLGFLSFHIYKAALFYVTALITTYVILRTFLITMAGGVGVSSFVKIIVGRTSVSGGVDQITNIEVSGKGSVGDLMKDAFEKLPGESQPEKMLMVLAIALIAGIIVGIIVCILQKPAIIVITALMGGVMASQGLCSMLDSFDKIDLKADTVVANFASGGKNLMLSTILTVVLVAAGIIIQFKTTKEVK
jgi:hypothetical protein